MCIIPADSVVFQFHWYRQHVLEKHVKTYLKVSQTACSVLEKTWWTIPKSWMTAKTYRPSARKYCLQSFLEEAKHFLSGGPSHHVLDLTNLWVELMPSMTQTHNTEIYLISKEWNRPCTLCLSSCRYWNDFHSCASNAIADCQEGAGLWEKLKLQSRSLNYQGSLFELCSGDNGVSRVLLPMELKILLMCFTTLVAWLVFWVRNLKTWPQTSS